MHHFSAGGLYNGLILLIDDETHTYWDHMTGEAVHGPLTGTVLEVFPIRHTTVGAALTRDPKLQLLRSTNVSLIGRGMSLVHRKKIGKKSFIPLPFRRTMEKVDARLPEQTQGLGVLHEGRAVFFPMNSLPIRFPWGDSPLEVALDPLDGVPTATWPDGSRPFQLFSRWYGFSLTHPDCEIA